MSLKEPRPFFLFLLAVNGANVGLQVGLLTTRLLRRDWPAAAWSLWLLVFSVFLLYAASAVEEWRQRLLANLEIQREAIARDIAMRDQMLEALQASGEVEVRLSARGADKGTRH